MSAQDIKAFMSKQELFKCDRLNASLTKQACTTNKTSGRVLLCDKCPGLGEQVQIKLTEEPAVSKKICSVKGCGMQAHARGMCWKHEKSVLGINPSTGKKLSPKVKPAPAPKVDVKKTPEVIVKPVCCEPIRTKTEPIVEPIEHPQHYGGDTTYEAIKVIEAWELGFSLGNTLKYIARYGKKDPSHSLSDLKKAAWYLNREIERLSA